MDGSGAFTFDRCVELFKNLMANGVDGSMSPEELVVLFRICREGVWGLSSDGTIEMDHSEADQITSVFENLRGSSRTFYYGLHSVSDAIRSHMMEHPEPAFAPWLIREVGYIWQELEPTVQLGRRGSSANDGSRDKEILSLVDGCARAAAVAAEPQHFPDVVATLAEGMAWGLSNRVHVFAANPLAGNSGPSSSDLKTALAKVLAATGDGVAPYADAFLKEPDVASCVLPYAGEERRKNSEYSHPELVAGVVRFVKTHARTSEKILRMANQRRSRHQAKVWRERKQRHQCVMCGKGLTRTQRLLGRTRHGPCRTFIDEPSGQAAESSVLQVSCPKCGTGLHIADTGSQRVGVSCPSCGEEFTVQIE